VNARNPLRRRNGRGAPASPRAITSLLACAALLVSVLVAGFGVAAPKASAATCGTTNIALNKTATASSTENASFPAGNAVDGNTGTRWSSAFSDPQWLEVDLGSSQSICGVTLNWETAYATAFQIQVSTDNTNWTSIYSTTTGTGGTQNLTGLSGTGRYIRMYGTTRATQYGYSLWEFQVFAASGGTTEGPYGGTAAPVPGTVQAANYDTGGQGVAYNVTSVNGTANGYRSDGVDLETCTDTGCGYDLGWTAAGQWFKYTVDVAAAGTYTVSFRLASPSGVTDALHIDNSAGTSLSGAVNAPDTGGWQDWGTVTASVTLPAGVQTLTVDQDNAGWNIYYMAFAAAGSATTNLALGQPVTASSYYENYVPSNVTDGNTSTYWESTDNAFPQWFQVDLGSPVSISRIVMDLPPSSSWGTRTQTITIQGSTDGTNYTTLVASAGYTFTSPQNTVTVTFPAAAVRYLKLTFTANTGWPAGQLSELQVYAS
jgi:F5/8 type C domain-containing protein/carbohydrate binding protein with CBM6 domain